MTKQKILEKALLKAHKGGWNPLSHLPWKNVSIEQWQGNGMVGIALLYQEGDAAVQWVRELEGIIFNHDFAKAFFGEKLVLIKQSNEIVGYGLPEVTGLKNWQYHLQQMVIAKDPIKYLGDNL